MPKTVVQRQVIPGDLSVHLPVGSLILSISYLDGPFLIWVLEPEVIKADTTFEWVPIMLIRSQISISEQQLTETPVYVGSVRDGRDEGYHLFTAQASAG